MRRGEKGDKIANTSPLTLAISKSIKNISIKFRESITANKYMTFSKRPLCDKVCT